MLEELEKTLDYVEDIFKQDFSHEKKHMLVWAASKHLLDKYIFLVPNEKNYVSAKTIQNIDSSKVTMECEGIHFEFGLFPLLRYNHQKAYAMKYLKENSIIIEQDKATLKEFDELTRIANDLSDTPGRRVLTRRNVAFDKNDELKIAKDKVNAYVRELTKTTSFLVTNLSYGTDEIAIVTTVLNKFYIPGRDMHSQGEVDQGEVMQQIQRELDEKIDANMFLRNAKYDTNKITIRMNDGDLAMSLFGKTSIAMFNGEMNCQFYVDEKRKVDTVRWQLTFKMPYETFMKRAVKYL